MLSDRVDKPVYTKNIDGTAEKWYLEQLYPADGTCFLRKSTRPKWIDTRCVFPASMVYETRHDALKAENPSTKIF